MTLAEEPRILGPPDKHVARAQLAGSFRIVAGHFQRAGFSSLAQNPWRSLPAALAALGQLPAGGLELRRTGAASPSVPHGQYSRFNVPDQSPSGAVGDNISFGTSKVSYRTGSLLPHRRSWLNHLPRWETIPVEEPKASGASLSAGAVCLSDINCDHATTRLTDADRTSTAC